MDYSDEELETMDKDELLKIAKRLSKWSRECYKYLIRKEEFKGAHVRSAKTGQLVGFPEFIEECNLGKVIQDYVSQAITEKIKGHK